MKQKVRALLFEAYRRNEMCDSWEKQKPLSRRWLGLGTAAAYRPVLEEGYMVFHDGKIPPPRCMGWLVLTEKGIETLQELETEFAQVMEDLNKTEYPNSILANYMLAGGLTK